MTTARNVFILTDEPDKFDMPAIAALESKQLPVPGASRHGAPVD